MGPLGQYVLQPTGTPEEWECLDTLNGISLRFMRGRLHETKRIHIFRESESVSIEGSERMTCLVNGIEAFLCEEFYELALPSTRESIRKQLGRRIAEARECRGLTTAELAEAAGMGENHLRRLEAGRFRSDTDILGAITAAMGCHLEVVPDEPDIDAGKGA